MSQVKFSVKPGAPLQIATGVGKGHYVAYRIANEGPGVIELWSNEGGGGPGSLRGTVGVGSTLDIAGVSGDTRVDVYLKAPSKDAKGWYEFVGYATGTTVA